MADNQQGGLRERWEAFQPTKTMLAWSCVGAVVATIVVGFTWGGWVTGGTAQEMAEDAGDQGRAELAASICVENFLAERNAQTQLTELKDLDSSFRQRQFVEEGDWALMPDQDSASRQAASRCAELLANFEVGEPTEEATIEH